MGASSQRRIPLSFIQREIDRINAALLNPANQSIHESLYVAQQALTWANEQLASGLRTI
jgi:flagellin-like hook-associated protein FlgL